MIAPWWDCLLVGDSVHYGQGVWPPPDTMKPKVFYLAHGELKPMGTNLIGWADSNA